MTSLAEPERIHSGRALRFAARPSRCNASGALVTAVGGSAFRRSLAISRQFRQRLLLGVSVQVRNGALRAKLK